MLDSKQLQAHYSGISSSTAAAVVGLDPFKTPYQAWRELVDPQARQDISRKWSVRLGNAFEDAICDLAAERWRLELMPLSPGQTLRHPQHSWAIAHPDRLVINQNAAVEAKYRGARMRQAYRDAEGPLTTEYVQAQWQILVGGFDAVYLAAVIGDQAEPIFELIARNDADIELLLNETGEFWARYVLTREPPPAEDYEDLKHRYPIAVQGKSVEISSAGIAALDAWEELQAKISEFKHASNEHEGRVIAEIGDAETALYMGRPVATYKQQPHRHIAAEQLRADLPQVAAQYTVEKTIRVLRRKC